MFDSIRCWWNKKYTANDLAGFIIWRSTALFGDFRMNIATDLLKYYRQLTDEEYNKILQRYDEHVSHWNIPYEVIARELGLFARAAGRDPKATVKIWWDKVGEQILKGVLDG